MDTFRFKLVVFDIDDTLIDFHSETLYEVRPHAVELLEWCFKSGWTVGIWSLGNAKYVKFITEKVFPPPFDLSSKYLFVWNIEDTPYIGNGYTGGGTYVKRLEKVWNKFPQFSSRNTILVDDLSVHIQANPENGLQVLPFMSEIDLSNLEVDRRFFKRNQGCGTNDTALLLVKDTLNAALYTNNWNKLITEYTIEYETNKYGVETGKIEE